MILFTVLVSLFALVAGGLALAAGAWEVATALFVVAIFGLYVAYQHYKPRCAACHRVFDRNERTS